MKTKLLLLALMLTIFEVKAQIKDLQTSDYLKVKTIEPDSENYADLLPLIDKIGSSKIVGLGESRHDDGLTLGAKCRLVKFLHDKMGFDVLLFESGFIGDELCNYYLRRDTSIERAIYYERGGWGYNKYSAPIFKCANRSWKTPHPLEIGGFDKDGGLSGYTGCSLFLKSLIKKDSALLQCTDDYAAIDSLMLGFLAPISSNNTIITKLSADKRRRAINDLKKMQKTWLTNKTKLESSMSKEEYDLLTFSLDHLIKSVELSVEFAAYYIGEKFDGGLKWNRTRDSLMASTLFWLMEHKYKDKKIILWAATGHLMKDSKAFITRDNKKEEWHYKQMGDYLNEKYKDDYYLIAFTSYGGERGEQYTSEKNKEFDYVRPVAEKTVISFESKAHATGNKFIYCDIRKLNKQHWLRNRFIGYAFGDTRDEAEWYKLIDAFFFIDVMKPSLKLF